VVGEQWKMAEIPSPEMFQGPVTHSAHWDHSIDFKDKTVAIIGAGSSSIQITPQLKSAPRSWCVLCDPQPGYRLRLGSMWRDRPREAVMSEPTRKRSG